MDKLNNPESYRKKHPALEVIEQEDPLIFEEFSKRTKIDEEISKSVLSNFIGFFTDETSFYHKAKKEMQGYQELKKIDPKLLERTCKAVMENLAEIRKHISLNGEYSEKIEKIFLLMHKCYLIMREFSTDKKLFA